MSTPFTHEKTVDGDVTYITLKGSLDEDAAIADAFKGVTQRVVVDLMGVQRITSGGVREWISAVNGLPDGAELSFTRCSVQSIEYANTVSNFVSSGRVESFLAPYYSERENKEYTLLIDVEKYFPVGSPLVAPDFRGAENVPDDMEFDDDEEEYFLFLEAQRRREKSESGRHRRA